MTQFLPQGWQAPHFWTGSSWQPEYRVFVDHPQTCVEIWTLHLYSCVKDEIIRGHVNIWIIFSYIGNSQWCLFNTLSKMIGCSTVQLIFKNDEKAILNINMPYVKNRLKTTDFSTNYHNVSWFYNVLTFWTGQKLWFESAVLLPMVNIALHSNLALACVWHCCSYLLQFNE